ncbi:Zinc knuckle [Trichostrongylus colubriformis]|uniref:Zinc knuckle n=1 Tax=Trichostrongylus colubriformis TaxID=6319 RepID=A0AAN8J280_TRICO
MDPATVLSVFKELIEEQRNLASTMMKMINRAPQRDQGAGHTKTVEATTVEKRQEVECWNCGGNHYARHCKSKPWYCKKCRKTGHKEKFCDILQQKKPGAQEDATKKMRSSNREGKERRKAPRRQVRTVQISNAAVEANCPRVYVDTLVNNYHVRFLLDTGSDITLLNEETGRRWDPQY